jgi:hypothetical protein
MLDDRISLAKDFLYPKLPAPNKNTITMGMGYRKVSTATQIIPMVRVFGKSIERMEPVIRPSESAFE